VQALIQQHAAAFTLPCGAPAAARIIGSVRYTIGDDQITRVICPSCPSLISFWIFK